MAKKSVVTEAQEIQLAIELINLGARLQLLESETSLSRERLLKLYKELKGVSPPKGMLPFSTDWFITWQPNIHSSLFINIHRYLVEHARINGIEAVMKAYKLYLEQVGYNDAGEPVLSLTRAWTLVRFFESKMLMTTPCCKCNGHFVVHRLDLHQDYLCGLCHMPSRAGKTKKAKDAVTMGLAEAALPVAAAAPLVATSVLAAVA
ncbi:flagellar transcription activator regulator protein [Herbaspirillum sp. GW103]|uniref:flagellar transcriptional regulator FlhC n=1 Tax=unclassified Herbaspirillum TaxID=2624150 RepID=UPI00025E2AE2|nr:MULTISPECIES: flagellar transcriptional regulator FlhC [unclassified Herbaspirillum]EIJ48091.1 flagellar transcription activator regulator protein [Herbaspirillum sp. GW103]MCI1005622.1 flagellar transcriptional regulator FlhC [Herbaspirillum sp. C7C8]NUT62521.1 flagellar transcriptional regulator FlhC [Herbaspirillum sp. C9C3]